MRYMNSEPTIFGKPSGAGRLTKFVKTQFFAPESLAIDKKNVYLQCQTIFKMIRPIHTSPYRACSHFFEGLIIFGIVWQNIEGHALSVYLKKCSMPNNSTRTALNNSTRPADSQPVTLSPIRKVCACCGGLLLLLGAGLDTESPIAMAGYLAVVAALLYAGRAFSFQKRQ